MKNRSWLKNARGMKRISSRELGELCGKSQIYIQKLEGGDRDLPQSTANEIYKALGFNPAQVPFQTHLLLEELEGMEDELDVALGYVVVDGIIYFNSIYALYQERPIDGVMPTTVKFAKLLLESQLVLFG